MTSFSNEDSGSIKCSLFQLKRRLNYEKLIIK